ncbi:protein hinderin isoform X2 [Syngnathoides biaculeatus]|uniref:protein hinderin isoform X2 n=1 Tax=Syngnathoides biaculeatus TaxID=300417 RepID=UPI002ADE21E5|nr:protein hinderin isoform X2 [Syngnathoides biaculeatus]
MAAAAEARNAKSGIFWMESGVDEVVSCKPGVMTSSSKKSTKMQARRTSDCNIDVPLKRGGKKQSYLQNDQHGSASAHASASVATANSLFPAQALIPPVTQVIFESSRTQSQVSLKDLCPEDKRRIGNLIEELARVSEEKEESVKRLKDEHDNLENKIQKLEQENLVIAHERESLQQQYRECQELLGLYQQYLTQQQIKLNQSIAELSQAQADYKVLSSDETMIKSTSQANGLLFDGSYLSLAASQTHQPQGHRRSSGRRGDSQAHYQGGFHNVGDGTQLDRLNGHSFEKSCEKTSNQSNYGGTELATENKEVETIPQLGCGDWEEKRHQLLLQKMQLEMEREKLQTRLADQEERLSRQNQQLSQSHLDCIRFQEACQSKHCKSLANNGTSHPDPPHSQDFPSRENHHAQQCLHDNFSQTAPLDKTLDFCDATVQSKKDKATSPVEFPASPVELTTVPVTQKTSGYRPDFSVVDLLDIFSPSPALDQCRPSSCRSKSLQHGPLFTSSKLICRSLPTAVLPYPLNSQQDLEESQILEDIFFIY